MQDGSATTGFTLILVYRIKPSRGPEVTSHLLDAPSKNVTSDFSEVLAFRRPHEWFTTTAPHDFDVRWSCKCSSSFWRSRSTREDENHLGVSPDVSIIFSKGPIHNLRYEEDGVTGPLPADVVRMVSNVEECAWAVNWP